MWLSRELDNSLFPAFSCLLQLFPFPVNCVSFVTYCHTRISEYLHMGMKKGNCAGEFRLHHDCVMGSSTIIR